VWALFIRQVFKIKCRYKYCKNGNEVSKEEAIKDGNSYYCKDCYKEKTLKQEIEKYYTENLPKTTIQILRKVINQLLYTDKYEAEYILFIVKKIHINNLKINNPFGLKSYCNEGRNQDEWRKININKQYNNIKENINTDFEIDENKKVVFKYKSNKKKWTDLI
jgi:hypothetical protein